MVKTFLNLCMTISLQGCQTAQFSKTVSYVDINQYMGKWYVIASRPTMFEKNAFNATESYSLNPASGKIDVDFRYNKGGFDGDVKSIPQEAYVFDHKTNAHLKIGVWFLPFDLDYLIIGLDANYQWTVVGVPNQKYLWVMARTPQMSDTQLTEILNQIESSGYSTKDVARVYHKEQMDEIKAKSGATIHK